VNPRTVHNGVLILVVLSHMQDDSDSWVTLERLSGPKWLCRSELTRTRDSNYMEVGEQVEEVVE
jgi:hypothetical protein